MALAATVKVTPEIEKYVQKKLRGLGLVFPKPLKFMHSVKYIDSLTSEFDRATRELRISNACTRGTVVEAQVWCSKSNPPGYTVHQGAHESFDALIVHEFAHCIHATIAQSTVDDADYRSYMEKLRHLQKTLGNPSPYSEKNLTEWTAEQFTLEWMGKGNGHLIKLFLEYLD